MNEIENLKTNFIHTFGFEHACTIAFFFLCDETDTSFTIEEIINAGKEMLANAQMYFKEEDTDRVHEILCYLAVEKSDISENEVNV